MCIIWLWHGFDGISSSCHVSDDQTRHLGVWTSNGWSGGHVATKNSNGAGKVAAVLYTSDCLLVKLLGWFGYWLGGGAVEKKFAFLFFFHFLFKKEKNKIKLWGRQKNNKQSQMATNKLENEYIFFKAIVQHLFFDDQIEFLKVFPTLHDSYLPWKRSFPFFISIYTSHIDYMYVSFWSLLTMCGRYLPNGI